MQHTINLHTKNNLFLPTKIINDNFGLADYVCQLASVSRRKKSIFVAQICINVVVVVVSVVNVDVDVNVAAEYLHNHNNNNNKSMAIDVSRFCCRCCLFAFAFGFANTYICKYTHIRIYAVLPLQKSIVFLGSSWYQEYANNDNNKPPTTQILTWQVWFNLQHFRIMQPERAKMA